MSSKSGLDTLRKKHGFRHVDVAVHPRLILTVTARQKRGKTHFALGAPKPIAYYNMDMGLEGVASKYAEHQDQILEYPLPLPDPDQPDVQKEAAEIWQKFEDSFNDVLRSPDIRTIVVDTTTELWELLRLARLGSLTQVYGKQYAYTPLNAEFRRFLRRILDQPDKNLILLHKTKPEWIDDKRTGRYERAGFADIDFIAQAVITLDRRDPDEDNPDTIFTLKIDDSRHNPMLNGYELEDTMCTFPVLATMLIEGTDLSDWGYTE